MRFTKLFNDFNTDFLAGLLFRLGGNDARVLYWDLRAGAQSNWIGMYSVNVALTATDVGITKARALELMTQFEANNIIQYDRDTNVVWVVDAARLNIGQLKGKDNNVKCANAEFASLRMASPAMRSAFWAKYADMLCLFPEHKPAESSPVQASLPIRTPVAAQKPATAPATSPVPKQPLAKVVDASEPRPDELDQAILSTWGLKDLLRMTTDLRKLDRDEYPVASDAVFDQRVKLMLADMGQEVTTQWLDWAMKNRDLSLDQVWEQLQVVAEDL